MWMRGSNGLFCRCKPSGIQNNPRRRDINRNRDKMRKNCSIYVIHRTVSQYLHFLSLPHMNPSHNGTVVFNVQN
jgi:hypothetical protein